MTSMKVFSKTYYTFSLEERLKITQERYNLLWQRSGELEEDLDDATYNGDYDEEMLISGKIAKNEEQICILEIGLNEIEKQYDNQETSDTSSAISNPGE